MTRLIIGIILCIAGVTFLLWFNQPKIRRKMRARQRSGRKTFEEMSRKEFGEAYSRLMIIPAGLGNIYVELNFIGIAMVMAGIGLIYSFVS